MFSCFLTIRWSSQCILVDFCDSCNLCLYYVILIVLQFFLLKKKLTDVHLSKSQMHFYQPHGNLQTVKRTTLGAGKICVKCVICCN